MPEPPAEYTQAVANIKAFRGKVLTDLVGSRIIAGLDASHDSMEKYSNLIAGMSVTPYLFAKVREKALALQLKTIDVGVGGFRKIVANYNGPLEDYPMNPPYAVPQRQLPQVDVFIYTPVKDIDLLRETDMSNVKSFVLIQCPSDTFEEQPEAENSFYDYYSFFPQNRGRGEWTTVMPRAQLPDWLNFEGEKTFFRRTLTPHGTTDDVYYYLEIFVEPVVYDPSTMVENPPIVVHHPTYPLPRPSVTYSIAGQHIGSTAYGLFTNPHNIGQYYALGFCRVADGLSQVSFAIAWKNEWTLTMEVEPEGSGTTSPEVGDYKYQAEYAPSCEAYPEIGYVFDHWEKDGVNKGSVNPISVPMDKNIKLKAVFVPT